LWSLKLLSNQKLNKNQLMKQMLLMSLLSKLKKWQNKFKTMRQNKRPKINRVKKNNWFKIKDKKQLIKVFLKNKLINMHYKKLNYQDLNRKKNNRIFKKKLSKLRLNKIKWKLLLLKNNNLFLLQLPNNLHPRNL
jgi:hypothetical protein